ncbi:putative oxidoreductase bli-4, mitochondrial [Lachnellula hyalina]|uniref:Putative oxidoreductase bli-4, mitochondrial n=1 Tax=Lachnellula hyalina TaxID=1316788 RepID=A0A8H8R9J8_9HELO|nr:putative oxidoreductase bli-4, mitochondrial [Lachnellula hyalina]TVY31096.1 putative oxidoreductase bli-4, mitochondrial [Lachnellula hyalina]
MAAVVDTIKNTIAENFGGAGHNLASKDQQFPLSEVPDVSGKVAVVTGGTAGIGYACVRTLLANNISKIFIISSNKASYDEAHKSILEDLGEAAARKITYLECDMADWPAVATTANKIADQTDRVDIMINDAGRGIMTYQLTDYGVDRHMAVNHFGHVILTSHLLPVLKSTAEKGNTVRLVGLGSNAHQGAPSDVKFASLEELNQDLGPNGQYGRSKLAVMLYHRYLAKHLTSSHPKILSNSVHPGFVETKMSQDDIHEPYPVAGYAMSVGLKPLKKDQWEGAASALYCATKTEKSGQYVCPPAIPEPGSKLAQDEDLGEALMALTKKIVKEKMYSGSVQQGCPFEFY